MPTLPTIYDLYLLVAIILIAMCFFHYAPLYKRKQKKDTIPPPKKTRKYTSFDNDFIEIEKLARLSSNKVERDEVTRLIYLYRNEYKAHPEMRFNSQILEGINNRVRKPFVSQFQPLN